ncbi:sortase [bacterium]|nr:sortase [bacterium]
MISNCLNKHIKVYKKETLNAKNLKHKKANKLLALSNIFLFSGLFVFAYLVLAPSVLSYTYDPEGNKFIKPFQGNVLSYVYSGINDNFYFEELNPSSWDIQSVDMADVPEYFYLSIPKLGIEKAQVDAESENMKPDEALGHYRGTSLPGEVGNSFIFGHSSMPIFYDPTNYKTIFTKIPDLDPGDKIIITYKDVDYSYTVRVEKEMLPAEVNPYGVYYASLYNKSTVTLMTCTPPGSKKFRYIILAELD